MPAPAQEPGACRDCGSLTHHGPLDNVCSGMNPDNSPSMHCMCLHGDLHQVQIRMQIAEKGGQVRGQDEVLVSLGQQLENAQAAPVRCAVPVPFCHARHVSAGQHARGIAWSLKEQRMRMKSIHAHAQGAEAVSAYVTHGVFPRESWHRFIKCNGTPDAFKYFWITDSCPRTVAAVRGQQPFEVLSLAGLIAAALQI